LSNWGALHIDYTIFAFRGYSKVKIVFWEVIRLINCILDRKMEFGKVSIVITKYIRYDYYTITR